MNSDGPVLRVFEAHTKSGCADKLLQNFATSSADVVRNEPDNRGYFFGRCIQGGESTVIFVSVWKNLAAIKKRFGNDWQNSHLPEGYTDLIDECSVRHFDMSKGWHVAGL